MRLARWSTLQRIAATLGPGVLVLFFASLLYVGIGRESASRAWVTHANRVIEALNRALLRLTDAETGQRDYLLTRRPTYLDPYAKAKQDALRQLGTLRVLASEHPAQQARLDTLAALARAKFTELDASIAFERAGNHAAALAILDSDRGKRIMDDARRIAAAMEQTEITLLTASTEREAHFASLVRWILGVGTFLAVAVTLLINTLLARHAAAHESSARELEAQNARLEQQTLELELQNQRLQEQAVEVEVQQQRLQDQAAELEAQTEELVAVNMEVEQTAEEFRVGQERLRLALGAGRLGPWEWDIVSGAVTWSAAVEAMHGLAAGTFPGTFEAFQRDLHPEDRERALSTIAAVVAQRKPHHLRYRIVRADGEVRWLEAHGALMFDAAGHPARLVGVCADITERQRAEDDLRFIARASGVLASSLDSATTLAAVARLAVPTLGDWCAVDVLSPRGTLDRLTVAHPDPAKVALATELEARYPGDPSSPVGRYNVLRTGASEMVSDIPDELLMAGARDAEHLRIIRALGLRSYMAVPLAARGAVLGVLTFVSAESGRRYTKADVALAEDLAQRAAMALDNARLVTDMAESRRAAETANAAKSEFLATMSHELRTPLNAISGYVDLLTMEIRGPVTDAQREDLTRIKKSGQHLLSLINDILNLARIEAGRLELSLTDVQLADALTNVEALTAPQMQSKGLTYTAEHPDIALTVRADAEKLQQILLNLLTNACKFTAPGGQVVIECDPARNHGADMVVVRVRDTGRGIPAEKLASVFEPFVQIDRHLTHQSQQGVGLGLAISRHLARAMGGELTAESIVGKGSTFSLTLPCGTGAMDAPTGERPKGRHAAVRRVQPKR